MFRKKKRLSEEDINQIKGAFFGFFVGDALGVPVEFKTRASLEENPVVDMREFGTHNQEKGTWSDDTSMVLATMDSIIKKGTINDKDIMNNFVKWYDEAEYTPNGKVFDIGNTTARTIERYKECHDTHKSGDTDIESNGNGSLMRILPISILLNYTTRTFKEGLLLDMNYMKCNLEISCLTHAHMFSVLGCTLYSFFMRYLLIDETKEGAFFRSQLKVRKIFGLENPETEVAEEARKEYFKLLWSDYLEKCEKEDVKSSGYVVDTIESVIYSILRNNTFKSSVLEAVNLGNDTDTIGALTGALAGLKYGYNQIPTEWIDTLKRKDYLEEMVDEFIKTIEYF